jgi:5'-nucleotidase
MNILLTNDDGVGAEGIHRLAAALCKIGTVYVYAPAEQKSACGHGITLNNIINTTKADFPEAFRATAVGGTPADCVKIGVRLLKAEGIDIDILYSGVNHGWNLGTDTLYSGTVSAAVEGILNGIPSVAVSLAVPRADSKDPLHFETACAIAARIGRLHAERLDPRTALNINTPNLPADEIKGLKITRLARLEYEDKFIVETDGESGRGYKYNGRPILRPDMEEDADFIAHRKGYATITPLRFDLTHPAMIDELRSWNLEL